MQPHEAVMMMEPFCQDVKHLRKCCLSVTMGICRRNFAVHHPAIGATGAAGVLICQPNCNGPLLFPEQLYPSGSSRTPVFSSHLSSTVSDGCLCVSGCSVNVTVLQSFMSDGVASGDIPDCTLPSCD